MKRWALLASLFLTIGVRAASAVVITFSGLPGPNFTPFVNPYVESAFTVTPTVGSWFQGLQFGNPVPSIFSTSDTATVDVTQNGVGLFRFSSVDLADADSGGPGYTLQGFLLGVPVFSTSGGPLSFGFATIPSPNSVATIDLLRITMVRNTTSSYNVDNINVTPVPEPAVTLPAVALSCLGLRRRFTRIAT
jgi:hypothetical protein